MKKLLFIILILLLFPGCEKKDKEPEEDQSNVRKVSLSELKHDERKESLERSQLLKNRITGVQCSVYRKRGWRSVYSVIDPITAMDTWNEFSMMIESSTIGYDSFNDPGQWTEMDVFRIQFLIEEPQIEVMFYIDDIMLMKGTEKIFSLDFEEDKQYFWLAKGIHLDGNNTIVNRQGRECLLFYGIGEDLYNAVGVEIQFDLFEVTDFSTEDYSISFKYYILSLIK